MPHHGSRSFGADKGVLVARNLRRLRRRYPAIREASAAFRAADPLRAVRARLEEACPPAGHPSLFVGPAGSPILAERLHRLGAAAAGGVVLAWRRVGARIEAALARHRGQRAAILRFDAMADDVALEVWLAALSPAASSAGPPPPAALLGGLLRLQAPIAILAGEPRAAAPDPLLADFEAWRAVLGDRWTAVIAQERATSETLADGSTAIRPPTGWSRPFPTAPLRRKAPRPRDRRSASSWACLRRPPSPSPGGSGRRSRRAVRAPA